MERFVFVQPSAYGRDNSCLHDAMREIGAAIGIAIGGSILAGRYAADITGLLPSVPEAGRAAVEGSFAGAVEFGAAAGPAARPVVDAAAPHCPDTVVRLSPVCHARYCEGCDEWLDEPRVAQPRHLVHLEAGAQATLVERYVSLGESLYCTNAVMEVALGRDAVLKHERLQMESRNAFHLTGFYLVQDENSRYSGINIGLGARWARTDLNTRFRGEHAECLLQGLYLAGDGQLLDYHLDVEHAVPNCRSEENFKGLLTGQGRAVFDGRVLVSKDAQKSDAAMSNRNLMLSEQAEIDTKPQLEIYADDVKCSHGTTVGQIEPEMLFYLRSRGIDAAQARRMLCLGFAGEIIDRLGDEAVREHVAEAVGQRLA